MTVLAMTPEMAKPFFDYLDELPEDERPVFGLIEEESSLWQKLGGGGRRVVVLIYNDRIVFSTRSRGRFKELRRDEFPLSELEEIHVHRGPLLSSVLFRFSNGIEEKLASVPHDIGEHLSDYTDEGLDAFDRSKLHPLAIYSLFAACDQLLSLPKGLLKQKK